MSTDRQIPHIEEDGQGDSNSSSSKAIYPPPYDITGSGVTKLSDISYVTTVDSHARQKLDLYIPPSPPRTITETNPESFPLIVYIHGGAFMFGSKDSELMPKRLLVEKRYAIASLDYRLSGDAIFPAAIHDCKAAIRYLRANAAIYNLDPNHFVVWGESAGGHIAAMLGVTSSASSSGTNFESSSDQTSTSVSGVVDLYGPTDFSQMDTHTIQDGKSHIHLSSNSPESKYLGVDISLLSQDDKVAKLIQESNPITYFDPSTKKPAFLIAHGTLDHVVCHHQSELLYQALREGNKEMKDEGSERNNEDRLISIDGTDHVFLGINDEQIRYLDGEVDRFLERVFAEHVDH